MSGRRSPRKRSGTTSFLGEFPDPLGFGHGPSRFSDPRRNIRQPFGVYYVGATFDVAFLETIIRDMRNRNPGILEVPEGELTRWAHVEITVREVLDAVDLRGGNPVTMGIPTDAVRGRSHGSGRTVSLALFRHADMPDAIYYPSRLNEDANLAVYDHAIRKLAAGPRRSLDICPELAPVLDRYRIAVV